MVIVFFVEALFHECEYWSVFGNCTFIEAMSKRIMFVGPISCGKSVRREQLENLLSVRGYETSDLIKQTRKLRKFITKGNLVPDEDVCNVVIPQVLADDNCIISGFPRTALQARNLWLNLSEKGLNKGLVVVNLIRSKNECEALSSRRGRGDDAHFEKRWADYEKNHPKVEAFMKARLGSRWIDFRMTDSIEGDSSSLAETIKRRSGVLPRKKLSHVRYAIGA